MPTKQTEQEMTWGDVMWSWLRRGYPREEAAYQADQFMRRREAERKQKSALDRRLEKSPVVEGE